MDGKVWEDYVFCTLLYDTDLWEIYYEYYLKEYGSRELLQLLQENIYGQVYIDYQETFRFAANVLWWCYPPDYSDELSPTDFLSGTKIKHWFVIVLNAWIWEQVNVEYLLYESYLHGDRVL